MTWQLAFGVTMVLTVVTAVLERFGRSRLNFALAANAAWSLSLLVTAATVAPAAPLVALAFGVIAFGRMAYVLDLARRRGRSPSPMPGPSGKAMDAAALRSRNLLVLTVTVIGIVVLLAAVLVQPR